MKTAVFYGPGNIKIENRQKPKIKDGDMLIRVEASAICGTDLRTYKSGHPAVHPPQVLGHENAGIIAEAGKKVEKFKPGDRVAIDPIVSCGHCYYCRKGMTNLCLTFKKNNEAFGYYYPGGFAEYMLIPERAIQRGNVIQIPDELSFEEATIAEPMACALNGQQLAKVSAGDTVLLIGAGPISLMHASLSRILGATKIIIAEINQVRLEMAKSMGVADYYINSEKENLKELVMKITEGITRYLKEISEGKHIKVVVKPRT